MVHAWPDGSIQARSQEQLTIVFEMALAFDTELKGVWEELGLPGEADVVRAAHCLLGGYDGDSDIAFADKLARRLTGPTDPRSRVLREFDSLFHVTAPQAERRRGTKAAWNKTKALTD